MISSIINSSINAFAQVFKWIASILLKHNVQEDDHHDVYSHLQVDILSDAYFESIFSATTRIFSSTDLPSSRYVQG